MQVKRPKVKPADETQTPNGDSTPGGPAAATCASEEGKGVEGQGEKESMEEEDEDVDADTMVVDPPADVVTAGAAATIEAERLAEIEEDEEDEETRGWAGVSTLKLNTHRVGPGQPVLLVEQYTQSVCCTRRVFISVLHVRVAVVRGSFGPSFASASVV